MKKTPRVSVLTPVYNTNLAYLAECIESVLNQTFSDFEFIILNDSPDNKELERIIKKYEKQDSRIKYVKNAKNMGITPSRNRLLSMALGEYLAILDHDDVCLPERFQAEVEYLDLHPDVGVVSCLMQCFGDSHDIWNNPEKDADIKIFLTENCYIAHTAAMIRKAVLINNDIKYEEFYSPAEDYRLWTRLMEYTHFYNIQKPLVKYRVYRKNTSHTQQRKMAEAWRLIKLETINKYPGFRAEFEEQQNSNHKTIIYLKDWRLRLFGKIPFLKRKKNWILLFDFIPLIKIRGR